MERNIISDDRAGILDDAARNRIPVVTDPAQAEALLHAVCEALSSKRDVNAEFRAGAVWTRKGYDDAGDFSPLVSPSPHRDNAGSDEVYLSVSVRVGRYNEASAVKTFVDRQRAHSERDRLAELESEAEKRRLARDAEQAALGELEARAAELRAATSR